MNQRQWMKILALSVLVQVLPMPAQADPGETENSDPTSCVDPRPFEEREGRADTPMQSGLFDVEEEAIAWVFVGIFFEDSGPEIGTWTGMYVAIREDGCSILIDCIINLPDCLYSGNPLTCFPPDETGCNFRPNYAPDVWDKVYAEWVCIWQTLLALPGPSPCLQLNERIPGIPIGVDIIGNRTV